VKFLLCPDCYVACILSEQITVLKMEIVIKTRQDPISAKNNTKCALTP
jgi:hypothetical protein